MTTTARLHPDAPLAVRPATAADAAALRELALLDSARPLRGEVVLAETAGTPVAALSLTDGRSVADPFARTREVREMLRAYATRVARPGAPRRSAWSGPLRRRHVQAAA